MGTRGDKYKLNFSIKQNRLTPPLPVPSIQQTKLKADTGASSNYLTDNDKELLRNWKPSSKGPRVHLPDGDIIASNGTGQLPIPGLSPSATTAHTFQNLKTSLLSIGQLCDDGCLAIFTKQKMYIIKDKNLLLQGDRNTQDGLWDVLLPHQQDKVCAVLRMDQTKNDLAKFLHACCFSPTKSTFTMAIKKGNFVNWPGLTVELITKYLQPSLSTEKGHLRQERKNLQSTKDHEIFNDAFPEQEKKSHECFMVFERKSGASYSDLTGRFPITSSRGNQYLMIMYDYDTNSIQVAPTKTKTAAELRTTTLKLLDKLDKAGHKPRMHIMDNEASQTLKQALKKHNIDYQLVPPHIHRRNAAERAIQTFKAHFIAGLVSTDPSFPAHEWDRLLPQAELTLNMLRTSRISPHLSAYATLNGIFDYNKTPLLPPGTKTLIHEKCDNRTTWAPRGTDAWYIGPALDHYRCVTCYVPITSSTRIADTISYFPHTIPIPKTTTDDYLKQAIADIITILGKPRQTLPCLQFGDETRNAIQKIAEVLGRANNPLPRVHTPSQDNIASTPSYVGLPRVKLTSPQNPPSVGLPRVTPVSPPTIIYNANKPKQFTSPTVEDVTEEFEQPTNLHRDYIEMFPKSQFQNKNTSNNSMNSHFRTRQPTARPRLFPYRYDPRHAHSRSRAVLQLVINETERANTIYNETTGQRETYDSLYKQDPKKWGTSMANELGRLTQGVGTRMTRGNDNLVYIKRSQVPIGRKITYANAVCDHRPLKPEQNRVRLTVGGDKLPYYGDSGSPAASILDAKIIINSTISTKSARFMAADINDYFLESPMATFEYMRIPFRWIPEEIRLQYNLYDLVENDGYIYVEIRKGMYGLKQAARLAYDVLVKTLKPFGYAPVRGYPNIWKHNTRQTIFSLCVDDFGIKYLNLDDANHLLSALRTRYRISTDWTGSKYLGLTINWNYHKRFVEISMPGYIEKRLKKFNHPFPRRQVDSPHTHTSPVYGQKIQYAPTDDITDLLDKKGITRVQEIVGSLLFYGRALDSTILPALNEISTKQAKPTEETKNKCNRVLDYLACHPDAIIRFHASDMILHTDTDAAYLVLPKARSRIAAYYYLSDHLPISDQLSPRLNGALDVDCKTIRRVVTSAAESETEGIFSATQKSIPLRRLLIEIGHPQPINGTPIKTDNLTAKGILSKLIKPAKSKSWDIKHHWISDQISEKIMNLIWRPGSKNWADYFTKHWPTAWHKIMRPKFIQYTSR